MRWREWLGVGESRWEKGPNEEVRPAKTLWDWLQLLIVPAILIGVTFVWSASQSSSDNRREDRRIAADRAAAEEARQDTTLQGYLDQMSGLMLREKLLTSTEDSAVRPVARTVTLAALRRLDGERKAAVVQFLYEAQLLGGITDTDVEANEPLVVLGGADLRGTNFKDAELYGVVLPFADLTGANLAWANLHEADLDASVLRRAQLEFADLSGAGLTGADLTGADLSGADLSGAYLMAANLQHADLTRASLDGASLQDADIGGADLSGANLKNADIRGANLVDAEDPDDRRFTIGLDLSRHLADLSPPQRKEFLNSQKAFLDSLSLQELARFKLTPETLAKFRREADLPSG